MRALRTATINHNDKEGARVTLRLVHRQDGEYCWLTDNDEDTGVTGASVADACDAARHVWGADVWDLQAKWL
jgi:hypothetical protein